MALAKQFTKLNYFYCGGHIMKNVEQTFYNEIEVERIKAATKQGLFMFFASFGFSIVFVFVLWDYVSHSSILLWLATLNIINLVRWRILQGFNTHNYANNLTNIQRVKIIMFAGSMLGGLCWGIASLLFVDAEQPYTLLIMSAAIFFVSAGATLAWFCFIPAAVAFIIPATGFLIVTFLLQGTKESVGLGLIMVVSDFSGLFGCIKVGRIFNSALLLNFENVALRKESEEKSILLETALENMGQGISMSDKDDRLRMWNSQFTELLGCVGNKVKIDIDLESVLKAADPPLKIKTGNSTEHQLTDGRVFEVRQSELQYGGRVLTYTDISDLIKREQALEEARKVAEQANTAKTRFLAAASHDLRQPIHALGLFFAELSDRVHNSETNSLITQVNGSINAINSMLNALLDVSKLDAGVVKPNIESFALTELFLQLESDFIPIATENHNTLKIRPSRHMVTSDPFMLDRILRNLIGNALRYTRNGRILVSARQRNETVQIQVFDNGPGIPEDQLDEVFIEFHQIGNPARDRQQGLGLGLAIVKRLTSLLGHNITVTSKVGRGSCFSITLPLTHVIQAKPDTKLINLTTTHALDRHQVLVLDDDNVILEGMRGLLTRWGCQAIIANSPAEAFAKLDSDLNKPELLIIDYRLPDNVSGIEFAKNLQNILAYPLQVLIITGDTAPERLREADASGFPLLHKPVQPAKLRSVLQYLLSKQGTE